MLEIDSNISVLFDDGKLRLSQDKNNKTFYEVKCSNCGSWNKVNFKDIYKNIDGIKVGKKESTTYINYPYDVKVVINECEKCGFTHVYDANEYYEITDFSVNNITDICTYKGYLDSFESFRYNVFYADIIAKYIIGKISRYIFMFCNYEPDIYLEVKKSLQSNEVMEVCLIGVMMCDLINKNRCTEQNVENWYKNGKDIIPTDILDQCNIIASMFI